MKYDVVIIGSGLGGLECGFILAKKGLNVCILEKEHQIGGCLQSFKRGDYEFDTGFHYVGGLSEGQPLHKLFDYFGLLNLPWHQLDTNGFDEVILNNKSYMFANGYDNFANSLAETFPSQKYNLQQYTSFIQNVGNNIFDAFKKNDAEEIATTSLFAKSAYQYLVNIITDPLLVNVLSGTSLKLDLDKESLPLYVFAQINSSFIQSAYRLNGSGSLIAKSLADSITNMGGTVKANAEVVKILENNEKINAVELSSGEIIEADIVISDIHPTATFTLMADSHLVKKVFRKRMDSLQNTFGAFIVNIGLKKDTVPYKNRNIYIYNTEDVWDIKKNYKIENIGGCLVYYQVPRDNSGYTRNIDIITPMRWEDVEKWTGSKIGQRGSEYKEFKEQKAQECIDFISRYISEIQGNINKVFTSTPLTYQNYTATAQGCAYGIIKDYQRPLQTLLTPRTPVPNLFLTGQNLNLHGILGVSITSFITCNEVFNYKQSS